MRPAPQSFSTLFSATVLLPLAAAITLNCESILADSAHFNLKPLGGVHTISHIEPHPPSKKINSTYTLDVCGPLQRPPGVEKKKWCDSGTYVCATQYILDGEGVPEDDPFGVINIAGQYSTSIGGDMNPKVTRLKTSSSHADSQQEGVRIEIGGGNYLKRKQKAVIEFICTKGETEKRDDDEQERESQEEVDDGQGGTIKFLNYGSADQEEDILRLSWRTKYACEDAEDSGEGSSGGWGFFSWFFFLLFLAFLAYLIFGAWLNYNRYGARGWDLLPHGDLIRDIPYILQDWFRKVVDTLQGGQGRGAYSAI